MTNRSEHLAEADDRWRQGVVVRGARQNNLADVDLDVPRDRLVVFTGVSGSGKSGCVHQDGVRAGSDPMTGVS